MSLKDRIQEDLKAAMRAGDGGKRDALRLLTAEMKRKEVDERIELDDGQIAAIVEKMIKQRRDAIQQFEAGGRQDLADKERFETGVLQVYLPEQLDDAAIDAEIASAVAATGATGPQDMGKLMAALKPKLAGKADMSAVSARVKAALSRA